MKKLLVGAVAVAVFLAFHGIAQAAYSYYTVTINNIITNNDTGFRVIATDKGGSFTNRQFSFPTSFSQAGKTRCLPISSRPWLRPRPSNFISTPIL